MKIFELFGIRKPKAGQAALEIEVEGVNLPTASPGFNVTRDGSLRGEAYEYVSRGPKAVEELRDDLLALAATFKAHASQLDFSFRTSVHVHVNVLDLDVRELSTFCYLYTLFEESLIQYSGESRRGNRFCLRIRDSDEIVYLIIQMFSNEGQFLKDMLDRNGNAPSIGQYAQEVRYSSMNLASIPKFGSLEFRSLRGTADANIILPWVNVLLQLKKAAVEFKTPRRVRDFVTRQGSEALGLRVFGDFAETFLTKGWVEDFDYNFSLTIPIPHEVFFKNKKAKELEEEASKGEIKDLDEDLEGIRQRLLREAIAQNAEMLAARDRGMRPGEVAERWFDELPAPPPVPRGKKIVAKPLNGGFDIGRILDELEAG